MKDVKKILSLMTAVCLSLLVTACSASPDYAAVADGEEIPAGVYIYMQYSMYNNALRHEDYDSEKDPLKNKIEDKPLEDWVNAEAEQTLKRFIQIEQLFKEMDLKLDQETLDGIDEAADTVWENKQEEYEDYGISKDSYRMISTNNEKYEALFKAIYGEGGKEEISHEDLLAHYKDEYALFRQIKISKVNAEGEALGDDELKEQKALAEKYLKRAKKDDFDELIKEYNDSIATEEEDDGHDHDEEDGEEEEEVENRQMIKKSEGSAYLPEALSTAIFEDYKLDKPYLYDDDAAFYVTVKEDVTKDESLYDDMRDSLLKDLRQDEFDEQLLEDAEKADVTINENVLNRYKVKKFATSGNAQELVL